MDTARTWLGYDCAIKSKSSEKGGSNITHSHWFESISGKGDELMEQKQKHLFELQTTQQ